MSGPPNVSALTTHCVKQGSLGATLLCRYSSCLLLDGERLELFVERMDTAHESFSVFIGPEPDFDPRVLVDVEVQGEDLFHAVDRLHVDRFYRRGDEPVIGLYQERIDWILFETLFRAAGLFFGPADRALKGAAFQVGRSQDLHDSVLGSPNVDLAFDGAEMRLSNRTIQDSQVSSKVLEGLGGGVKEQTDMV